MQLSTKVARTRAALRAALNEDGVSPEIWGQGERVVPLGVKAPKKKVA